MIAPHPNENAIWPEGYLNPVDEQYHKLIELILNEGYDKNDRTGTGSRSIFGAMMKFDLRYRHIPLLTTKKVNTRAITEELLWFLRGEMNIKSLNDKGVHIWDNWADENGELGPIYGSQWRDAEGVDQVAQVVDKLRSNPHSRRLVVDAWNPHELEEMKLSPCHFAWQLDVRDLTEEERKELFEREEWYAQKSVHTLEAKNTHEQFDDYAVPRKELSLQFYQRSCDMGIGVPFNIASYAILLNLLCNCGDPDGYRFAPGTLSMSLGNAHVYHNHFDQLEEQLSRFSKAEPPKIRVRRRLDYPWEYSSNDIEILDYDHHPAIKMPISV